MEKPRWLSRVFRAVGLTGDGDIGVDGSGDLRDRVAVVAVGRARASFGLAARASIVGVGKLEYTEILSSGNQIWLKNDRKIANRRSQMQTTTVDRPKYSKGQRLLFVER